MTSTQIGDSDDSETEAAVNEEHQVVVIVKSNRRCDVTIHDYSNTPIEYQRSNFKLYATQTCRLWRSRACMIMYGGHLRIFSTTNHPNKIHHVTNYLMKYEDRRIMNEV